MIDPSRVIWLQWILSATQVATLVAVIVYVVKTSRMASATRMAAEAAAASVEESRLSRKESSDPRLALYFASPVSSVAEIVIENYGETTATDITFDFVPPLEASQHKDLVVRFFETPKTIPPHGKLRHAFDAWPEYFQANLPRRYDVRIAFKRLGETEERHETHILDAGAFEHYSTWRIKGVHELTGRFERLADHLERWVNGVMSDRRSSTRRDDLIAEPRPLADSIADLLGTAELLEAAGSDETAHMFPPLYLPSLRKHSLAAFLAACREGAGPEIKAALSEFTLALYHHNWELLDQSSARSRLEAAHVQLRETWRVVSSPAV